jgi:N-acetylmuramoyl-L-alanine amidase
MKRVFAFLMLLFPFLGFATVIYAGSVFLHTEGEELDVKKIEEPLSEWDEYLTALRNWERPEGPITIALQAGHWKHEEAPEEFPNLATNTGASAGGVNEVEVNLMLAEQVKPLLEEKGLVVEILPATIPPEYYADLFVSIHGDGSTDRTKTGYKASGSWYDLTRKASTFAEIMEQAYGASTGLAKDSNISNRMKGYYAFNWRRYEHSLHPMTVGIILETGFITNTSDRALLVNQSEKSVEGIVNGIITYIEQSNLRHLLQVEEL